MDNTTILNTSNITCASSLLWNQSTIDNQKAQLYVCIIASIIHAVFWLQVIFSSSVHQKSIQWIYAYLITDIFLLFRYFFDYIIHTTSNDCIPNRSWALFICYFEATVDNYFNIIEVYILLALNICRYAQIAYNRNVYQLHNRLLIFAHLVIYLSPWFILIIEFVANWAQLVVAVGSTCDVLFTNVYIRMFNIIILFALPIFLNILVIYASVHHIHKTSTLRKGQHHVSAREKYQRSLVIQFLVFYTIWVILWSPNIIVYQIINSKNDVTVIVRLMNFIEIALDPIIIAALDVRFWRAWQQAWVRIRVVIFDNLLNRRRIQPLATTHNVFSIKSPHLHTTAL
jgi:hypothetical protein